MDDFGSIYKSGMNYESALKRILNCKDICQSNKKKIKEFSEYLLAEGLTKTRVEFYLRRLYKIAKFFGKKKFERARKEDIIKFLSKIEKKNYSEWTKHGFKVTLKKFFRWLRGTEEYPEEVKWIKTTVKNSKKKLPDELLTEEEVRKVAEAATHPRDRAFVLVLYESGCRIGELLSLRLRNVQFDKYGAVLLVNGKTGKRRVRIIASASDLTAWINNHPLKDNPDAPLWVQKKKGKNGFEPLHYEAARLLLKRLFEKAGVKKRFNPHIFRHSRATHLAKFLTEAQMKEYFGWVQDSRMAAIYVHLSGRDVDSALLKLHGFETEEKKEEKFKAKICPRCKEKNSPLAKFCSKCGLALDIKLAIELDKRRAQLDRLMDLLVSDPEVQKVIMKKLIRNISKMSTVT